MKKLILIMLIAVTFINVSYTQTSVWKVEGKGNIMYVAGTVHLLREKDYPLPVEFDSAYSRSEVLVFEADIEKLEDPAITPVLMGMASYKDERTLKSVLSEEAYNALEKECSKFQIPIANLAKFKPSMVVLTLTQLKMLKIGVSAKGVDTHYFGLAKKDKKELSFFEKVEDQLKMITDMGKGNEDEFVLHSLKEFGEMEEMLSEMIATWRDGSAKIMVKQIKEMKKDYPEFYKTLLVDRNNNWMPKIENFINTEAVEFLLMGALHLHGPDGILKKLKDSGCSVKQLKM